MRKMLVMESKGVMTKKPRVMQMLSEEVEFLPKEAKLAKSHGKGTPDRRCKSSDPGLDLLLEPIGGLRFQV